ncbi:MAG: ferrous iron transport protein B [Cytophagaceae bacterium]
MKKRLKVALIGNPNAGKSSLFNHLTGLNQKVGNFPGVTVDKKIGYCKLSDALEAEIIDLPGTYSIYPRSLDEQVVFDYLTDTLRHDKPDFLVVIIDASNFKRNLLLFTQIKDLGFPVIMALNMVDLALKNGIQIDINVAQKELNVPIVEINARNGKGVDELKAAMMCPVQVVPDSFYKSSQVAPELVKRIRQTFQIESDYMALLLAHMHEKTTVLSPSEKQRIEQWEKEITWNSKKLQYQETLARYEAIHTIIHKVMKEDARLAKIRWSKRVDRVVTHKVWGYFIFLAILFLLFQSIFAWSELPMSWIESFFAGVKDSVSAYLPDGVLKDFIVEGVLSGLEGVLIFIPQISILFACIAILEESGYMTRVMYIMDKLMRPFGLNGRSVVPLISGVACAVPAIMSTRSIESWKERMITIFVTPLMSCSARIPVFIVLIGLMIPAQSMLSVGGVSLFNMQGVVMMGLYLLGFISAILSAALLNKWLGKKERSTFIMEFPAYQFPRLKNVGLTILEKVKTFTFEAGKVILAISIILWFLASYGPSDSMERAEKRVNEMALAENWDADQTEAELSSAKLKASYAGQFGNFIEPVIRPLGYDWKIGIAIITSFAAREVFIGTMATIYSVGDSEEEDTIREKLAQVKDEQGQPFYTFARTGSLLLFYLFALQCMSTLAIVYRETKSWKWPILQFTYMTGLAYLVSFAFFQLFK